MRPYQNVIELMSQRTLSIVTIATMIAALCFLILPYIFFPQFYIPKANASMDIFFQQL